MTVRADYKNVPIPDYIHKLIKQKAASEGKPMLMVLSQLARRYVKEGSEMFKNDEPIELKKMYHTKSINLGTGEIYMDLRIKDPFPKLPADDYRVLLLQALFPLLVETMIKYLKELPSLSRTPKKLLKQINEEEVGINAYYAGEFVKYLEEEIHDRLDEFYSPEDLPKDSQTDKPKKR